MPVINKQGRVALVPSSNGSAWDLADCVRMLLYGQSGTGKTTLWATFPGPIRVFICSGGNRPGELRSINTPEYRKKITPVVVNSVQQLRGEIQNDGGFTTNVLDHASGFADLIVKELLGLDDIPVTKARQASKGESWSLVSQQQYGQLAVICKETFREMLNLQGHLVIVAQERTFGEESTGEIIKPVVGAALTPSVTGWLNPACDFVVQTFKRARTEKIKTTIAGKEVTVEQRVPGVDYCLRTGPHETYMTKFRIPRGRELPEVIVDPTFAKIDKLIKGV